MNKKEKYVKNGERKTVFRNCWRNTGKGITKTLKGEHDSKKVEKPNHGPCGA